MIVKNTRFVLNTPAPIPPVSENPLVDQIGVKTPRGAKSLAQCLILLFAATVVGLAFLPWQQTVTGRGQLIAFNPNDRKMAITAPISGLVEKWHVYEGSRVKAGDPIADLRDPDPDREKVLQNRKIYLEGEQDRLKNQIASRKKAIAELKKSQQEQIKVAEKGIEIAKETVQAREKLVNASKERWVLGQKQFSLFDKAVETGVLAGIRLIEQQALVTIAEQDYLRSLNEFNAAKASLNQAEARRNQVEADTLTGIEIATQELNRLEQSLFTVQGNLEQLDTEIRRFNSRFVKAPVDGTILSIEENSSQGGSAVKDGSVLAFIVPESQEYVVELFIDGVDAPLIQRDADGRYPHVRLQFEGWPAVQFTGWPSAAYGTFGGRVRQIDQAANSKGQFRILVEPDNSVWEDDNWPSPEFLRQGNQAVGWVFLQRVTLGWEVWRRLNGFPPVVAPDEPGKAPKDGKSEGKPLKVKVP